MVEHYRQRGYRIHENVKVRGSSGAVHACQLVAQGPLGNLIVSFGDASGVEGPELAAMRRTARDVGATAVAAVPEASRGVEEAARRHGVKILDDRQLVAYEPVNVDEVRPEAEDHPWPEQEPRLRRAASRQSSPEDDDDGLWKHPRRSAEPNEAPRADGFAWLEGGSLRGATQAKDVTPDEPPSRPSGPAPVLQQEPRGTDEAPHRESRSPAPRPPTRVHEQEPRAPADLAPRNPAPAARATPPAWRWIAAPLLWGVATGGTFFVLSLFF